MYHRLDPRLPQNFALDDVTALTAIQDFGHTLDLNPTLDFVDKYFVYDDVSALLRSRLWYALCLTTVMTVETIRQRSTQCARQRQPLSRCLAVRSAAIHQPDSPHGRCSRGTNG